MFEYKMKKKKKKSIINLHKVVLLDFIKKMFSQVN